MFFFVSPVARNLIVYPAFFRATPVSIAVGSCDDDDCPAVDADGITGRVCDDSCEDGVPYGTLGCEANDGDFGNFCRVCYFDDAAAIAVDSADERAIM